MIIDSNSTFPLDWRSEFKKLQPYLRGQGGVVRIWYDTEDCAPHRFNAILKESYQGEDNHKWTSIRIDGGWHTTHLLEDILDEFNRKLIEVGFDKIEDHEPPNFGAVLTENEIEGDFKPTIENSIVGSYIEGSGSPRRRDKMIERIFENLKLFLLEENHFMIVMNHASQHDQSHFWRLMWRDKLESLVSTGLLLIHFIDRGQEQRTHADAPLAELELHLPRSIRTDDARQDHVFDDLIDVFRKFGLTEEAAPEAAHAYLQSNLDKVSDLHDNLLPTLLTRKIRLSS